jgi:hypothetical protein
VYTQNSLPFETVADGMHRGNSGNGYFGTFYFCLADFRKILMLTVGARLKRDNPA